MAFGQQQGRPASARQLRTLESLLRDAGYSSFREARGPLQLNQRQGGGKFTADEADALIARLEEEAEGGDAEAAPEKPEPSSVRVPRRSGPRSASADQPGGPAPTATSRAASSGSAERREARQAFAVRDIPAKVLARELEKRGWILIPPEDLTAADPTAGSGPQPAG